MLPYHGMRVTLVHNPSAGGADHSGSDLTAWVRAAGHTVTYHSTNQSGLGDALAQPADLLIVAGGDGTVRSVVRKLVRHDTHMAILPLGESNNIASTLGLLPHVPPDVYIACLATAAQRKLDVAIVRAPWGTDHFLESAGVGCFASLLRNPPTEDVDEPKQNHVVQAVRRLRQLVERASVSSRRIVADGVELSGSYLLAAALNTRCIGPQIELAPDADPGDGWLDLVLVREEDRQALCTYLTAVEQGRPARMPLPSRRAQRIWMSWNANDGYIDDELWPEDSATGSSLAVDGEEAIVELMLAPSPLYVAGPVEGLLPSD